MKKILCFLAVISALSKLGASEFDMIPDLSFKTISYNDSEYKMVIVLRREILQKPEEFICQKEEINHIHIVGYLNGELCASAALVPENDFVKMQRVVVKTEVQRQGIGSSLLKYCEEYAKSHSFTTIYCYSRIETIPFYLKNNYKVSGEVTYKNNIPHQKMTKLVH